MRREEEDVEEGEVEDCWKNRSSRQLSHLFMEIIMLGFSLSLMEL